MRASGWSGASGSAWKTSSPAWPIGPLRSASIRAASSINAPRGISQDHATLRVQDAWHR